MKELKLGYRADTKEFAELELEALADKWESTFPVVLQLEKTDLLFQVHSPDMKTHLYNQYRGGLSTAGSESNEDQRGFVGYPKIKKVTSEILKRPLIKWRGQDSNLRPSGYEPDELPAAPPRDLEHEIYNLIGTKVNTFL